MRAENTQKLPKYQTIHNINTIQSCHGNVALRGSSNNFDAPTGSIGYSIPGQSPDFVDHKSRVADTDSCGTGAVARLPVSQILFPFGTKGGVIVSGVEPEHTGNVQAVGNPYSPVIPLWASIRQQASSHWDVCRSALSTSSFTGWALLTGLHCLLWSTSRSFGNCVPLGRLQHSSLKESRSVHSSWNVRSIGRFYPWVGSALQGLQAFGSWDPQEVPNSHIIMKELWALSGNPALEEPVRGHTGFGCNRLWSVVSYFSK